jgi:hypothetical protein
MTTKEGDASSQLRDLLQVSYEMPADPELEGGGALRAFLRNVRSTEVIDQRLVSIENQQLGQRVDELLETAPITDAFKRVVVHAVRKAHAWEREVEDAIAPDRLGIQSGPGIFDPEQARQLEVQVLCVYLADVVTRNLIVVEADDGAEYVAAKWRPADAEQELTLVTAWIDDFEDTYQQDPFDGIDDEALWARVHRIQLWNETDRESGDQES